MNNRNLWVILPLMAATLLAADTGFLKSVPAEKFAAAGLPKLTQAELAELEQLVTDFHAPKPTAPEAKSPGWLMALITLQKAGDKPAQQGAVESILVGDFTGWRGHTSFKLENGQVWTQINPESYEYAPALKSPKVKIYPATFGSFWLEIEGVNTRCRVKPVRLE